MPASPRRANSWLRITLLLVAALLCLPYAAIPSRAQEMTGSPIAIGMPAQISYSGGQDVLLRSAPGYDQMVVSGYPEGTPVEIAEGPLPAADGSTWFGVVVYGEYGYLPTDFLTAEGATAELAAYDGAQEWTAEQPAAAPVEGDAYVAEDGAQELTVAQPAAAPVEGGAHATSDLNLRAGPSYDGAVLLVIPGGAALTPTGEAADGFLGVLYDGQWGWADAAFVGTGAAPEPAAAETTAAGYTGTNEVVAEQPAAAPAESTTAVSDPAAAPAGGGASVVGLANLHGGPSEADAVLRVLPPGSPVQITGAETNGYVPVWYNGTDGWIASHLIDGSGAATTTAAAPAAAPVAETTAPTAESAAPVAETAAPASETAAPLSAWSTTEPVNLRAEPAVASPVIGVVPDGVSLDPIAGPENGFYQVNYEGQTGWVAEAYLGAPAPGTEAAEPASASTAPGPGLEPAATGGGGLIWPVTGGSWTIMQGYNGSSHQNQGDLWQYQYSLDLTRSDGNTAGQPVVAPASGTVRWLDRSSGGISIDIGNGHAVALFHVSVDPGLQDGDPVAQGQVIGHISGSGEAGFSGTPHVHFALWQSDDGGNWSRTAVPFTGAYAIAGQEFPDTGGANQYRGTEIVV